MSNKLKDWSTTAANNNSTPPNGWPEGMAPSKVNDTARQDRASIREWYEDAEWIRYAHTISASDASSVTIEGDVTSIYVADRAVRLDQDSAKVGYVSSSSYSAPNTTVNIGGITVSSPSIIEVGAVRSEKSLPNDVVGSKSRNLIGYPPGFLYGLRISSAADTDHDITVGTGNARAAGDDANINLTSTITKQLDAAWAEGNNAGGLPSGVTLAGPQWLYFFVIAKSDGTVDAGFDDNASATNLLAGASGYSYYRFIGAIHTDATDNIDTVLPVDVEVVETLTSGSSWTVPPNVLDVRATIIGAGGGGGGGDSGGGTGSNAGSVGGSTTFNGESALGGLGGKPARIDIGQTGRAARSGQASGNGGGAGVGESSGGTAGTATDGGGGKIVVAHFSVTPGAAISYAIGSGGSGGPGGVSGSGNGANGGNGEITLEYKVCR